MSDPEAHVNNLAAVRGAGVITAYTRWAFTLARLKPETADRHGVRTYPLIGRPLDVPALNPTDPPLYESEATYLKRLRLLLPTERRWLTAADFEPEKITDTFEFGPGELA